MLRSVESLFEASRPGRVGYSLPKLDVPAVGAQDALGGMARAAKCGERTFGGWFCSALVALFSGVVTHMLMQDITSISDTVRVACASVSAYSGGVLLDAVQARIADVVLTGINRRG